MEQKNFSKSRFAAFLLLGIAIGFYGLSQIAGLFITGKPGKKMVTNENGESYVYKTYGFCIEGFPISRQAKIESPISDLVSDTTSDAGQPIKPLFPEEEK